jgi:CheY-like chemotaxis protein
MACCDSLQVMSISIAHNGRSGAKLILLAEDSAEDAQLIQLALRQAGVANPVVAVSDGLEAMDYLAGNRFFCDREKYPMPGVLLLDLKMPSVDGFQVLEWCQGRPNLKDILVVVISGDQDVWRVTRAYELGARTFLVKPCTVPEIINLANAFPGYLQLHPVAGQSSPRPDIKLPPPPSR